MSNKQICDKCGLEFKELLTGRRLVPTGFLIFDTTADCDVPDMDTCDREDCRGKTETND